MIKFRSIVSLLALLGLFSLYGVSYANQFVIKLDPSVMKSASPRDLSQLFYAIVLAQNYANADNHYMDLAQQFFTPELFDKYQEVIQQDAAISEKKGELGCFDWDPLLSAQDVPAGFFATTNDKTNITIHLISQPKINLRLHFVNANEGYKIDNIYYSDRKFDDLLSILKGCLN